MQTSVNGYGAPPIDLTPFRLLDCFRRKRLSVNNQTAKVQMVLSTETISGCVNPSSTLADLQDSLYCVCHEYSC